MKRKGLLVPAVDVLAGGTAVLTALVARTPTSVVLATVRGSVPSPTIIGAGGVRRGERRSRYEERQEREHGDPQDFHGGPEYQMG
jgi:hypothetical protein